VTTPAGDLELEVVVPEGVLPGGVFEVNPDVSDLTKTARARH
jgi:hypothetical protein